MPIVDAPLLAAVEAARLRLLLFPSLGGEGVSVTGASSELAELAGREYQYGFSTDLDTDVAPRGLSEEIITQISAKKG
jgi:hypothetical protein